MVKYTLLSYSICYVCRILGDLLGFWRIKTKEGIYNVKQGKERRDNSRI